MPKDKTPPKCEECGGHRFGKYILHNNGCSKSSTATQIETPEEDIHIHLTPSYKREIQETVKRELIEEFLVDLKRKYRNDVEYTIMVEKWEKRLK